MTWAAERLRSGLPVYLFVLAFAIGPAAWLIGQAVASGGPGAVGAAIADPLNGQAIENSLLQGGLSAAATVAAGYPVGVLLGRYDWFGRSWARSALIVPFLLPTLVVVLGVQDLFGPTSVAAASVPALRALAEGVPGIVLVNVVFNVPLVALLTAVGVETSSAPLEESLATLGAGPGRLYRTVWGPPSLRGALAGGVLTFLFSALAFAGPLLLCGPRCYTIEARIWSLVRQLLAPAEAAVLAGVMVLLLLGPTLAYLALAGRFGPGPTAGARPGRPIPWRTPSTWVLLAAGAAVLFLVAALLASVLVRAVLAAAPGGGPGSAWSYLLSPAAAAANGFSTTAAIGNSLAFAAGAAAIATLLALLTVARGRRRTVVVRRAFLMVPLLVSPVVLAFSLATVWRPWLGGNAEVWLLILLGQATLALPFTLQSLEGPVAALPRVHRESAEALGASPFTAFLEAELPLVRGALLTAVLFAFALGLGEFTATYFLATPSFSTVPVELYHFAGSRAVGPAHALAGLLVALSLAVFLAVERGEHRVVL